MRHTSYSIEPNGSLLLQPVTKDHQGWWECTATNRVATVRARTQVFVLGVWMLTQPNSVCCCVFANVQQLLSCWLHYRNQSPRGQLSVHLCGGEAGKHILGGRLWWRISTDVFSLVGVQKKNKTHFPWAVTMAAIDSARIALLMLEKRKPFIWCHFLAATLRKK